HSRGIIHRDIKPENVMIGEFGEVYLVDWGVAVSTKPRANKRLPLARDNTALVGTPSYLAPEMMLEEPASCETDVYLLGGTLYEILTGRPPHAGENLFATLRAALEKEPEYPPGLPPELVSICKKAMARDRDERFESA